MTRRIVGDVMTTTVLTVAPDTPYMEVAAILDHNRVSAVPVLDAAGGPVGVVSEDDLLVKEGELGAHHGGAWSEPPPGEGDARRAHATTASGLMTSPAVTIAPEATVAAAARLMHERHVKRLCVVDADGRLVGIVSRRDLLTVFRASDDELAVAVRDAFTARSFWTDLGAVATRVEGGIVTMSGEVERHSDAIALGGLARMVDGVVEVRNQLVFRVEDIPHARPLDTL